MFGQAKLHIPASDNIGETEFQGLSDELAMTTARTAAMTLSDDNHVPVTVVLGNGDILLIGYNLIRDMIVIGRGGWREYAQAFGGALL